MNRQFYEWLLDFYDEFDTPIVRKHLEQYWEEKRFAEKWGVYLEFFDSVGIDVGAERDEIGIENTDGFYSYAGENSVKFHKSRQEAQQEAIKKAFEILEQSNN